MTHEEQISKLISMLEIQQKMHETVIDMLKPAIDAAYEKGYAEGWNAWKTNDQIIKKENKT